jgi:hypothetical protein
MIDSPCRQTMAPKWVFIREPSDAPYEISWRLS